MYEYIGLTAGEAFVVGFIAVAIISSQYWPRVGAWVCSRFVSDDTSQFPDK